MEFLQTSKQLTEADLAEAEVNLGVRFTEEFKEHYLMYNGGYPIKDHFLWPEDEGITRVNHFFSVKYEGIGSLKKTYNTFFIDEETLPKGYIPFATDDGGGLFCIYTLPPYYNHVFFFDMHHYDPDRIDDYVTLISETFKGFIDNLTDGDHSMA